MWLSVIGYEGLYEVSNLGRVRSLRFKGKKRKEPLIMSGIETKDGYLMVHLSKDEKSKMIRIHRLVCESFILGRKMIKGEVCDHINTIRHDNRLENLRVCTCKENSNNPLTIAKMKGNNNGSKSLILRGVKDASIYHFTSSFEASKFFNYKDEKTVGTYISRAYKKGSNIITLKGEEFYYKQEL